MLLKNEWRRAATSAVRAATSENVRIDLATSAPKTMKSLSKQPELQRKCLMS